MSVAGLPWNWNASRAEVGAAYPCDAYSLGSSRGLVRAIAIFAPTAVAFRWLCQLRAAPYSYDWIDNGCRQSPRKLTPGLEHLDVGQRFLIGQIVEFQQDGHVTAVSSPTATRLFGHLSISYVVLSDGPDACRLVVKLNVSAVGVMQRIRRLLLAWGDLVMMRKQLVTLKRLAERR